MADALIAEANPNRYNFAFVDEGAKREMRRAILKAVAMPGHQVPFASRELPVARGWGTGGLQATMAVIGPNDRLKVIDQGSDSSVNAVNLRDLLHRTTGVETTADSREATVIQSRHRIPEIPLRRDQLLVLQVPLPEPLRIVEASEIETRRMHAESDYSRMWVYLYEDIVRNGAISFGAGYPVRVANHYVMSPSPIPRWDIERLNDAENLTILSAGREKRVYAVPPHTVVRPLEFQDVRFRTEDFGGARCRRCGSSETFLNEVYDEETGERYHVCSDSGYCDLRAPAREEET
ncbi:MAG: alpha-D-ribose 1-methylphosphonate 5-phosphate C-P-lyase PhnJ [Spirochaetota bacterium]